jgi:hypothetical protein
MDINENLLGLFDSPSTGSRGDPKPPNTGLDTLNEDLYGAFNSAPTPPKAEPPKAPPRASTAPTTPDLGKAPKWADIEAKPEYQALSPEEKAGAKARYFDYWVAPNAGSDAASLRDRFLAPPKPAAAPAQKSEEPGMFQRALDSVVGGIANLIEPGTGYLPNEQIPSAMRKVLEAQYRAAPNDIKIEMSTDPGMSAPLEKRALASIAREMNQRSGLKLPEVGTPVEEQNPITGTARNLTASALKIGPTAVKGVADIAQMATGGNVGKDTSDAMKRGMESIDELVGTKQFNEQQRGFAKVLQDDTKGVGDMFSYLLDNPSVLVDQSITTIGSMFLPAGAAKGAAMVASARGLGQAATTKAAVATSVATIAAQNAADTFTSLEDQPLANRYQAAATSAAVSVLASIATGGGAEGEIARRLAGDLSAGRIGLERVKSFLSAVFREGAQEAGEEAGNIAGEAVGRRELPSAPNAAKRTAFAGTLGGIMGGGVNLVLGGGPQAPVAPPNAPNQERIEPTIGPIPGVEPPAEPPQAEAAPTPPPADTPPPAAAEPVSEDDQALLDYAETRLEQLVSKAEGGFRTIFTDQGEIEQEFPPTPLTERERQEVAALQDANGDLTKLRQLFGAQQNPPTAEEPVDGTQAPEAEQAAPQGQEPGSPAAEVGQAQDPIDGLGALFGGEQAGAATGQAPDETPAEPPRNEREMLDQRRKTTVIAGNEKLDAEWAVVDADEVKASMKEGVNQPRDRTRAASNIQVAEISRNPDFERLSDTSKTMDYGSPTLTSDGVIVGGNGRFEGVSLAYENNMAGEYRKQLEANAARFGLDPGAIRGMKKPVLVRRVTQDADTRRLAIQSNQAAGLQMSDMEQAAVDAERMTALDQIQVDDSGDIPMTANNIQAIKGALKGYTTNELAGFVAADGTIAQSGKRRIRNAILYKAYGKSETLARLIESPNADLKNVGTSLVRAAAQLAQARTVDGYDISQDITEAVETLSQLRAEGRSIEDFLSQIGMFGDTISAEAKEILQFMNDNIRSARAITEYLQEYAAIVQSVENAGDGLFGAMELPTKLDTLRNLRGKNDAANRQGETQGDLLGAGNQPPADGAGETGTPDREQPQGESGDARGSQADEGEAGSQEQVSQPAAEPTALEAWGAKAAAVTKLHERVERLLGNFKQKGWKIPAGGADVLKKELTTNARFAFQEFLDNTPGTSGKSLDARLASFNKALEGMYQEAFRKLVELNPELYAAGSAQSVVNAKEVVDRALANFNAVPKALDEINTLFLMAREYLTGEREALPPKDEKKDKLQNVGEKLWGSRKDLAKKRLGEGKTGDLDKDIQKVLDSASKTRVWNIVQPEGASTGTVVFLTEVRNRFPSLLEYVGSNAGGGRGRYEESFSEATKRKAKDEGIDFLIEEAADYIATMEQMREATRNAMSIAEAKAALDKLIGTIEYERDDRGFSKPKTNLTEFGEIATKYARLIVSDLNDYARRTKEDSSISKGVDRRPPLENIVRENLPDRRNGKDVNGDDFMQAFGFRGVEFGEWVNAAERQANINHAYDALWDLADALNMPAKAISFGGRMGLAFGSRGRGGRAAAHYEPNTNVINLTKTKGDGTVAHEWGHALDHFLTGEMQGFKAGSTASASSKKAVNSLKKALLEKYDIDYAVKTLDRLLAGQSHLRNNKRLGPIETARAYVENKYWKLEGWNIRRATNFKNEADRLGKDYWGTPVEMWARAFEAFVFDELGTRKSPYLVTGWVGEGATSMDTGYKGTPYASGVERAGFNDLFRDLVKNIEWSDEGPKVKDDYVSPTEGRATEVDQAVREAFQKRLDGEKKNDGLYWYQLSESKSKGQPGQPSAVSASGKLVGYPFPLAVEELKEFGMTVASASWQPGEGTIYAKPPAQEEPPAAEPDIDLGNMFDDLMREELAKDKPKTEREMRERQGQSDRGPLTSIQSAGKNTAEGLGNAIDGLGKLFGGNGKLNSGFTFDEETYAKAKPLFIAAAKNFVQAGQDIREAMRAIIRMVLDKFGQVAVENMKPYIVRFISDVQAGKIEFDTEPQEAAPTLENPEGRHEIARQLFVMLAGGQSFATINDARAKIAEITGTPIKAGTEAAKLADETVEAAVVMAGREIVAAGRRLKLSSADIYDRLVALYNRQPNLGVRSSTSVREQAYSTPVPLAFLASELAGITAQTRVLEPTAGNGMLLIGANPASVQANELNANRAAALRQMGFNVTTENAATTQFGARVDAVIANPPFGAVKDADGNTISFTVTPDYTTNEIDHAIAFNALKAMKDDGTAVLIVGGSMAKEDEPRRQDYRGAAKRAFYFKLYNEYNVVDHFTVAGSLYSKQGASYPVDVIVIRGRGTESPRALPASDLPVIIDSFEQLKEKLNGIGSVGAEGNLGSNRTAGGEGADGQRDGAGVGGETRRPGDGDGQQGTPGGDGRGMSGSGRTGNGRSGRGGSVSRDGQSQSENAPNTGDGQQSVSGEGNAKRGSRAGDQGDRSGDVGRSGGLDGQRLESGLTDRRGQEQETGSQVAYTPRSEAASVGTLVPAAMRDSIQESLQRIEDNVGSLDEYVAKALEMDLETARANFSAEQIDALALGIYNAEQGKGFIIGDQTGIGKGRVVAGMIRYALRKGRIPIFVTEKPNLYSDMIRDLDDIGMDEELGLTGEKPRIFMTNSDATVPYSIVRMKGEDITETNLNLKPAKRGEQLSKMMKDMIAANTLGDYRVIFTTYSQLQTVKGQPTERQLFVQHFGRDNFMIFDESHNAGGSGETQARTKGQREAQKEGGSLATGRAAFVRSLVTNAFGTFFSSATYAKRPDVMDLYASTNMKLAVNKISELAEAIKRGGVPMQQIVATMLTQDGQYIRRERTFAGVSYDTQETAVDKETAENMANSMRSILGFSRSKEAAVKAMQKELDKEGKMMGVTGEKTTVQGANFGSIMHNLIDQMLLSLKVQDSLRHAIERLKAGEKVVMTVSNTMGSFLKDYAEEMELNVGDPVSLSFADLYIRYLEKQRMVTIKAPNGQKTKYRLTDKDLGPTLTARYNSILEQIRGSGFGSAPISPIDFMHAELRKAGYKTDEITGRTIALNYSSGTPKLSSRSSDIKQRVNAVRSFNNGAVDVLILNQAGSTGLSLHASSKVKDQRKRHMIIVQPEKNIDTHMQMLGRVHRTGQVVAPAYSQMMADIPAEQRPAAVLLKKMASLNANTTASRKSAVTAEGVVDFMNDYGGQVVQEFLRDNPEIHLSIGGNKIVTLVDDPAEDANEDDIRKFTGYVPILPIKQQEAIYEELIARYNDLIERENSLGTNKLEAKAVDLDAETLSVTPITDAKEENSVFAREANMEQVDVKRTVKPFTSEEVRALVMKRLEDSGIDGANLPAQISRQQITNLRKDGQAFIDANDKRLEDAEADPVRRQQQKDNLGAILNHATTVLDTYQIGNSIQVKNKDGVLLYGVITDIMSSGRTQNPAAGSNWKMQVALANGDAKSLTLSFSQIGSAYELQNVGRINYFNTDTGKAEMGTVYDVFDKGSTTRREKRWIVTGNILAGYANWRGQIISYTKKDGTTGQGVLMNRQFDFEKEQKEAPVRINTTDNAIRFLTEIGRNAAITSTDGNFRIINKGNGYYSIIVPSSKKTGGYYFLDQNITKVTGDFFKSGAQMSVQFDDNNGRLRKVLDVVLAKDDVTLTVQNYLDQARKLLAPKAAAAVENISRNALQNISRAPAGPFAEVAPKIRADGLRRLEKAQARLDEGKITDAEFQLAVKEVIASMRDQRDERAYRDVMSSRRRGGDWIKSRMRKAVADGVIPAKEADFAEWLIDQNPAVAEQLGISIRSIPANGTAAANYNPAEKVFTLFKGETEGDSAVHEILHHTERMMPLDVQMGIRKEWEKQWLAAFRAASPERKQAMADMLKASMGDAEAKQRVVKAFQNRVLEFGTDYAFYSPSEFWAVNGARIMDDRFMADQSWVKRAIQWLKEFIERAKGAFGLRSDAPVIKGLKAVIKGDGKFVPGMQLLQNGPDSVAISEEIAGANLGAPTAAGERPTSVENMRRVRNNIVQFWANRRGTIKNFNAYDKSLATQYHKALKDGDFGKVFALTNAILNAVSLTSIRPAELAPGILPKAEDVRSAFATAFGPGQSQRDIKAAADAIFAGTLAGDTVMDGTVWTEAEFMAREGASQAAWALYQQARAAIDASIDELAAAEAYAVVQDMMPREARRQILDDVSRARPTIFGAIDRRLRVLNQTLSQAMLAQNDAAQEEIKAEIKSLEDTREKVLKVFGIAKRLKEAGYAPLMRFGKFAVTVTRIDPVTGLPDRGDDGDSTLFFGRYESESEAKAMRAELERQYAGQSDIEITAAPVSEKSHEMYSGISPETIAIFAETIGEEAAMKNYIENVMSERSALKRRLERKGTPGYSRELPRVLSNFITSNARYASQRYFMKELDRAISRISKKEKGDVRDEAIKLKQFVMNPSDGGAEISSLMFTWFLTGSVAAAAVNTTQTVTTTVPYLSQFASGSDAAKAFSKAMSVSLGKREPDPDLRAALKRASQEGIVDAQEIFHLYSVGAQGVATRLGNIVGAGEQARVRMNGFLTLLGSMFSLAEKFNRKVAFVAAYEIARESGGQNPYAFAVRAVNETQGIYSKANRPNWARNPAGRVILTFKQFSIMYMEMFARMVKKGGPEGKRAALFMLGILMLLAGEEGLPFAQDLNDLIDTLGQMLGFDTNMVRAKRRVAYEIFGEQLGDFMLYGLSSMLPMDWHGRLGLGNLIPGTGLLKPSNENMRTREFAEILGPSAGAATQIADAIDAGFEGKGGKAVQNALPKFAKDIATAAEWGAKGYATDTRGRKITEVDGLDVASKAIGFQPTAVARQQRKVGPVYQDIALQKRVESSIVDKWARGVLDGDQAAIAEASAKLDSWNAKNTDTPIVITPNQIRDRARGMAAERDGRMIKQAPREMRERVRQGLEEAAPAKAAPTTQNAPARPSVRPSAGLDSVPAGRKPPTEAGLGTALAQLVAEEGAAHLLPVIKAIRDQESSGGRDTRTSTDGAQGSMQLIPSTFRAYAKPGERIDNPADNIRVGARYIKDLADKFGNDPAKIAVGYFSGEGNVNRGQGEPWKRDFRDGNGKRVSSYANDIEARIKGREPS